jgi:phosphoglycerol transferase MdoB-like AlkP superfamily enzyme
MKKLFRPAALLFYLLTILVFFVLGMLLAGLSGVAEGQGLAGGAIVFFYGIVSAFLAFIVSLFIAFKAKHKTVVVLNKILAILLFVFAVYITFRVLTQESKETPIEGYPSKTTEPSVKLSLALKLIQPYLPITTNFPVLI